jgi:hypothetical protein
MLKRDAPIYSSAHLFERRLAITVHITVAHTGEETIAVERQPSQCSNPNSKSGEKEDIFKEGERVIEGLREACDAHANYMARKGRAG